MWALNRREFAKAAATGAGALAMGSAVTGASGAGPGAPLPPQRAGGGQESAGAPPLAPPDKQPPDLEIPQRQRQAGYAIVGLGTLALEEVMPAFGLAERSRPAALVSGHPDKARRVAEVYHVPPASIYDYATFSKLRDDSSVDVVTTGRSPSCAGRAPSARSRPSRRATARRRRRRTSA